MADNRIRIDEGLMEKARAVAREEGFTSVSDLVSLILRLLVRGKIKVRVEVEPELVGEQDVSKYSLSTFTLPPPFVKYEEREDVDGFKERVAVEVEATYEVKKGPASPDASLFDGEPLGPMVGREEVEKLRGVLKIETDLFKTPEHQPKVKWLDQRGDRWDEEFRELSRLGERSGG